MSYAVIREKEFAKTQDEVKEFSQSTEQIWLDSIFSQIWWDNIHWPKYSFVIEFWSLWLIFFSQWWYYRNVLKSVL